MIIPMNVPINFKYKVYTKVGEDTICNAPKKQNKK